MDRTVPSSGNEEIELYLRTYYSLLRSSRAVPIRSLVEAHKRTNSALHIAAEENDIDFSALTYSLLRMPSILPDVKLVLMGQSERVFAHHGYPEVETWQQVSAPGRRRRSFYNGDGVLAAYIASRSDIDDMVPILTAYTIERDKVQQHIRRGDILTMIERWTKVPLEIWGPQVIQLAEMTKQPLEDWQRLLRIWGKQAPQRLYQMATTSQSISVQSLAGSLADYKRATRRWWRNVEGTCRQIDFDNRPIYFVSSNAHALPNMLSGFAQSHETKIHEYISGGNDPILHEEYHNILEQNVRSSRENLLYYALKNYEQATKGIREERIKKEESLGIVRIPSAHSFDIEVQVIEMSRINPSLIDERLIVPHIDVLAASDALIINIDFPLGLAAYQVLSEMARNVDDIRGIYIVGKAATLNGRVGDVMIPSLVHDEHSVNTYLFNNEITADLVAPHLIYGTVLDNQKAITVPGTFLQNEGYMSVFYKEGYTDMEMEAGPYLSAIYELVRPKRHPINEIVDLHHAQFPIGIVHYASDTPLSKGQNLGAANLSYYGVDPTYATMIATTQSIFQAEIDRLRA